MKSREKLLKALILNNSKKSMKEFPRVPPPGTLSKSPPLKPITGKNHPPISTILLSSRIFPPTPKKLMTS